MSALHNFEFDTSSILPNSRGKILFYVRKLSRAEQTLLVHNTGSVTKKPVFCGWGGATVKNSVHHKRVWLEHNVVFFHEKTLRNAIFVVKFQFGKDSSLRIGLALI